MADKGPEEWEKHCAATPGRRWRMLAHDGEKPVEYADQGTFDELVVDHWLHLEQMDDRKWWMRVGDARIGVNVNEDGKVTVDVERGVYAEVLGSTTGGGNRDRG